MTIQDMIRAEALRQGIDPALALSLAQHESSFRQSAAGSSGEVGVFQLMPSTAADLGVNPYDLRSNIYGGVTYLHQMLDQFGSVDLALAAYNAGPGNVSRGTVPSSTWSYVQSVMATAPSWRLTADYRELPSPAADEGGPAALTAGLWPESIEASISAIPSPALWILGSLGLLAMVLASRR